MYLLFRGHELQYESRNQGLFFSGACTGIIETVAGRGGAGIYRLD